VVCTVYNGNGLSKRSGTVWFVPCITVTGWVRGQALCGMYLYNGNGLSKRSGTVWYVPCITVTD